MDERENTQEPASFHRLELLNRARPVRRFEIPARRFGASILGLVDHTHPTAAQFFQNAIVGDSLADHQFIFRAARGAPLKYNVRLLVDPAQVLVQPAEDIFHQFSSLFCYVVWGLTHDVPLVTLW
jgi:hypothetical protein